MDEAQIEADKEAVRTWAGTRKISLECINEIIELGFTSLEAIECLSKDDMKKCTKPIPVGQQKLIIKAVAGLSTSGQASGPAAKNVLNTNSLTGNSEQNLTDGFALRLAEQLQGQNGQNQSSHRQDTDPVVQGNPVVGTFSWQDPQVYLKSMANEKIQVYNIVDFVDVSNTPSEKIVSSGEEFEIVCRSGTRKPKLENLTISQWSAANIAILYKLHQDGVSDLSGVFDYLSYTSYIYGLISSHELASVYLFDREYRRLQALHKFRWGTTVGHLAPGFLRLRAVNSSSNSHKPKPGFKPDRPSFNSQSFQSHTAEGKLICRNYNMRVGCTFRGCKYEHVCNIPSCGKGHPGFNHSSQIYSHPNSKN